MPIKQTPQSKTRVIIASSFSLFWPGSGMGAVLLPCGGGLHRGGMPCRRRPFGGGLSAFMSGGMAGFDASAGAGFPAAAVVLVDGGPCAALGFFLWHAAMLVAF